MTRKEAQELEDIEAKDFGRLTMHVAARYSELMRMRPMTVITADNLHLVQVALSPAVNCAEGRSTPRLIEGLLEVCVI